MQTDFKIPRDEYSLLSFLRKDISESFADDIDKLIVDNLDKRMHDFDAGLAARTPSLHVIICLFGN